MYCPKCSHQPASDGLRFCPSCGFRLDAVTELLTNDGIALKEETPKPRGALLKWGSLLGITLMYLSAMLITLKIPRGPYRGESMTFLTLFWAVLVILISTAGPVKSAIDKALAKGETAVPKKRASSHSSQGAALPPVPGVLITDIGGQRANTAPIGQPPSVTEVTTSLLNNK